MSEYSDYDARYGGAYKKELAGKTVVAVDVARGEEALRFRCADGSTVVWDTDADCCSETWWADGFEIGALRGGTVAEVKEIEMPDLEDDRSRQEVDEVHGVEIRTDKGVTKFVYRNSSNGYYGGSCVLGEDSDRFEWREIEGNDWRA